MQHSLAQAAQAVGRSRSTVLRAIQTGRLSAARDEENGTWIIDASELHRVYQSVAADMQPTGAVRQVFDGSVQQAQQELIRSKDELISEQRGVIEDLRRRLDLSDEERRRLTLLLADQRQAPAPAPAAATTDSPRSTWGRFRAWRRRPADSLP